ncbi:hypothetical protein [Desulfoluna butyratoxydans]|uniref:DUF3108 domain-containing protein n=1 Tax=Desulfoluna butyratoxydans TaxID=231438 RepID=A0A4U8YQL1_9BACT|nr:hypothetical protein [Desulfoluna butyratoxydans]VFQ46120.1 hypothetical protein MSL71_37830 [Desulfoluna butyratoxydans]
MKPCHLINGLVCALGLLLASRSAVAESFDFRSVRWGMNRFEVMASEKIAPKRMGRHELLYRVSLFKRPAHLMYRLAGDRLVGVRYVLPVKLSDSLDKLEELVSLRYGVASRETGKEGAQRVWTAQDRTVRLFFPKKGQAVIDIVSRGASAASSAELASLRSSARDAVVSSL